MGSRNLTMNDRTRTFVEGQLPGADQVGLPDYLSGFAILQRRFFLLRAIPGRLLTRQRVRVVDV